MLIQKKCNPDFTEECVNKIDNKFNYDRNVCLSPCEDQAEAQYNKIAKKCKALEDGRIDPECVKRAEKAYNKFMLKQCLETCDDKAFFKFENALEDCAEEENETTCPFEAEQLYNKNLSKCCFVDYYKPEINAKKEECKSI